MSSVNFIDLQDGNPAVDDIYLTNGETYSLSISFLNELADPIEDITPEILDEQDEHQVFIYGDVVDSAATAANDNALVTSSYLDSDSNGLDVGLENEVSALLLVAAHSACCCTCPSKTVKQSRLLIGR